MSRTSLNLVDLTKNAHYKRVTPFKCVISNQEYDFICHTIFVITASDYFQTLYYKSEESCEIEPGKCVPRIRVTFEENLLKEYFRFAYLEEMQITLKNVASLLEFSNYLNSKSMLEFVEKFLCDNFNSMLESQQDKYLEIAKTYQLKEFQHILETRMVIEKLQV